jgi:hypothetical protein
MTDFDATVAIIEFLADESRSALELPHMTTGQRKKTKMLVDKYPELRCESFGFGAERQLHLFKIEEDSATQQPLLKNSRACQSTKEVCDSPDRSTTTSTDVSDTSCSSNASPRSTSNDREFESAKPIPFVNVRNTFIHYDSTSMDERIVQSLPHGMFGKCMLAEMSQRCNADSDLPIEQTFPSNVALGNKGLTFGVGTLVFVEGLVKAPTFNGLTAVVEGWDEGSGRYKILIVSNDGRGAAQKAMVKEENLRIILPCP